MNTGAEPVGVSTTRRRAGQAPTQYGLPFSGRSALARSCSMKAAAAAAERRAEKTTTVLRKVREAGGHGLTRWDVNGATGYQISSLCSILDTLVKSGLVVEEGSRPSGPFHKACTIYKARECRGAVS